MKKSIIGLSLVALLSCSASFAAPDYLKCSSDVPCSVTMKYADGSTKEQTIAANGYISHTGKTPNWIEFNIKDSKGNTVNSYPGNRCETNLSNAKDVVGEKDKTTGRILCVIRY